MLPRFGLSFATLAFAVLTRALKYEADQVLYNLNENEAASNPLQYSAAWPNHTYFPSPSNWRMPMYTLFLDRFVNGDPTNDNANGTQFEHDLLSNQLRNGGDVKGLQDTLDYIQGFGIKTLYLAGSPMLNMPWGSDGYSPLDLTLLDRHHGTIAAWRDAITEIHSRGMYVVLDNTFATLGDLIGFEGYLNKSTPFAAGEHNVVWKSDLRYHDFMQSDDELASCTYPRFWGDDGYRVNNTKDLLVGCRDSEFDQYGEVASFGDYTEWQRQLSKFAFVQDRLREWRPSVLQKIEHFSCMTIASLDIDGFRIDKAVQVTVDAQGAWSNAMRQCAKKYNKNNFYIPGEIVTGNSFGAIYVGRGLQPDMAAENLTDVVSATNESTREYIRDSDNSALDAAAFHYTVYRALTRFLGMSGSFEAEGDPPVNFVETWNALLQTNDMSNAYTGAFDPRHMFGVSNQDVFRWPAIKNGTEKNLLGLFVVTLLFPGIPTLEWGEEQAFYVLESTASNYVFGRSPMSSSLAWQMHGCYKVGNIKYANWPLDAAAYGCEDDNISLDHRDPSHPVRNIIKRMFEMRELYPVLNDGYYLQQLSNHTIDLFLPGSGDTPTETGLWSVLRSAWTGVQNLTSTTGADQNVWLLFSNENSTVDYDFDCNDTTRLVSPFAEGTTVKNLFAPYEEYTLQSGSANSSGCLPRFSMPAWGFKALVVKEEFITPRPTLTSFTPGHDYRQISTVDNGDTIHLTFGFSAQMDCNSISKNIQVTSTVSSSTAASLNLDSASCSSANSSARWVGEVNTASIYEVDLLNVHHGIHQVTISNVSDSEGQFTNAVDSVLVRVGDFDNPMVFPRTSNYSTSLLSKNSEGDLYVSHSAAGADQWRYSLNFGTTFSNWMTYSGGNSTLGPKEWSGTSEQAWKGDHVIVQYWSQLAGSSSHYQHGDLDWDTPRRFPNLWIEGLFNQYGYDAGLRNEMKLDSNATWQIDFQSEWPSQVSLNAWGINPDGQLDVTQLFGDVDGDGILDRIPPQSLTTNTINITGPPPSPYLNYRIELNDGDFRYQLVPVGSRWAQLALYILLLLIPFLTAVGASWIYANSFYQVKFNEYGVFAKKSPLSNFFRNSRGQFQNLEEGQAAGGFTEKVKSKAKRLASKIPSMQERVMQMHSSVPQRRSKSPLGMNALGIFGATVDRASGTADAVTSPRRTILIATMEYDIEDWAIKIKIGGLGVMTQLMGKYLGQHNLIWVVPCVGGVDYPPSENGESESMKITILGKSYKVAIQTHNLRNITYVLLDAPVFRKQTKAQPYPARMDDIESAIYYSAWNQCIAEAMRRYEPDLYHINDYHGCIAPLYLLPKTVPCALSLHNAEFQGLWPMRTRKERDEVCRVYNLDFDVVKDYVQFGEVFNLLHAGASYLRTHQHGFGAVGVSTKYGKRSYARYPIFWGLAGIGALPNPDPSDVAAWSRGDAAVAPAEVKVNAESEAGRAALREEAQRWAKLDVDGSADLFVFVGRWSMQKGVDLIADIFPTILEKYPKTQLICVGPVIDLYGKFAAIKLAKMMEKYPGRVYSNPEFTALPPYIFSGAEFALIPSRDEPFGLVAVEFGRKGALGVGARVGGLGQMPGWWYTIESTSTKHLLHQFKSSIEGALASDNDTRAILRARSGLQRFPVQQWVQDLETLQSTAIKKHEKYANKHRQRHKHAHRKRLTKNASPEEPSFASPRGRNTERGPRMPGSRESSRGVWCRGDVQTYNGQESPMVQTRNPSPATLAVPTRPGSRASSLYPSRPGSPASSMFPSRPASLNRITDQAEFDDWDAVEVEGMGQRMGPGHYSDPELEIPTWDSIVEDMGYDWDNESIIGRAIGGDDDYTQWHNRPSDSSGEGMEMQEYRHDYSYPPTPELGQSRTPSVQDFPIDTPRNASIEFPIRPESSYQPQDGFYPLTKRQSVYAAMLSSDAVVGEKKDFNLQKVDPFFTDPEQDYETAFGRILNGLSAKTTYDSIIEEFIEKSEKDWFNRLRGAKMGKTKTPIGSIFHDKAASTRAPSLDEERMDSYDGDDAHLNPAAKQFLLADDYKPPSGVRKLLLHRLGEWPVYSLLMALGQVISANSYQITLLTGQVGEAANKLYIISSIYLATSVVWWFIYRTQKSIFALSLPFVFFGLAFFLIGMAPLVQGVDDRKWIQNVAAGCYATASSAGSLYFALNFGDQGGAPVRSWVFRASIIQGTQQVYIAFLWCWGAAVALKSQSGQNTSFVVTNPATTTSIGVIVAVFLWGVGSLLFFGLPDYYRQTPGTVPSFLSGILRRKIVLWFFIMVILQNFFLSAPYGRNWLYLWSSQHLPIWGVAVLVIIFFIIIWAAMLYVAAHLSKSHSWVMPIFAIGLGAPRWCQMLWGVSGIGQYVPWASGAVGSAIAGRALWLWLGVLDSLQNVGFGMIMLHTLTRFHISFVLIVAQVLGSVTTMVARACAPDRLGPGPVFPDLSSNISNGLSNGWFWIALFAQLSINFLGLKFFRKEQLSKP